VLERSSAVDLVDPWVVQGLGIYLRVRGMVEMDGSIGNDRGQT